MFLVTHTHKEHCSLSQNENHFHLGECSVQGVLRGGQQFLNDNFIICFFVGSFYSLGLGTFGLYVSHLEKAISTGVAERSGKGIDFPSTF